MIIGVRRAGTCFSMKRSLDVSSGATIMTRSTLLGAALMLAALIAAPTLTQADEYYRHHRHHHHAYHHIPWFSYLHNYGPGPYAGTYAYYDGPTSVRCKQSAAAYRGQDGRRHPCY
jgi:hypothetical protein